MRHRKGKGRVTVTDVSLHLINKYSTKDGCIPTNLTCSHGLSLETRRDKSAINHCQIVTVL